MGAEFDQETDAIKSLLETLKPLSEDVRIAVLKYVVTRLDIDPGAIAPVQTEGNSEIKGEQEKFRSRDGTPHIKRLKEEKKPQSDTEMSVLVAYFLAHLAGESDRKSTISKRDIETYFQIAEYPLPKRIDQTLINVKKAGYIESSGRGKYKLNAVGYNLVAHTLPREQSSSALKAPRKMKKPRKGHRKQGKKTR